MKRIACIPKIVLYLLCGSTAVSEVMAGPPPAGGKKEAIEAEHQREITNCAAFSGNTQEICLAAADGKRKIAHAALEFERAPSGRTRYQLALTRAEATYSVSQKICNDKKNGDKETCLQEAEAERARAQSEAERHLVTRR